jgi:tRNA A-37 threonylcarbamoyl transferase component Bud32
VKEKVERLWDAGICHGDMAWRNAAIMDGDNVMLLDLGRAHCMTPAAARFQELGDVEHLYYSA